MKYFIITDVHGFYGAMRVALKKAGFDKNNPDHIFVSLGDAFDRGERPQKVLQYMLDLDPTRRILIRGNHEDLMEQAIARGYGLEHDLHNGTVKTAKILTGISDERKAFAALPNISLYREYMSQCIDYYETQNGIFVHGWIPTNAKMDGTRTYLPSWRTASREVWERARWINGMSAWSKGLREPNKTIFCGHVLAAWARVYIDKTLTKVSTKREDHYPWVRDGIVALDACTAYSNFVNCYVWEDQPINSKI